RRRGISRGVHAPARHRARLGARREDHRLQDRLGTVLGGENPRRRMGRALSALSRTSEPVPDLEADLPRPVSRFQQGRTSASVRLEVGVLDAPAMYPRAKRPTALLDPERGAVTVAALLRAGDVPVASTRIRKRGELRTAKEEVVLDYRGEHPSVAESQSRTQSDRRVEVVRITPVASVGSRWIGGRRLAVSIAPQVGVE